MTTPTRTGSTVATPGSPVGPTSTTLLTWMVLASVIIALAEAAVIAMSTRIPVWPAASGALTGVGLWLTLVLVRRGDEPRSRTIRPLVMFAGVYFITGAVGPALWLLTPLDPPGIVGTSQSALIYVLITFASYALAVLVASLSFPQPADDTPSSSSSPTREVPGAAILVGLGLVGLLIRFPSLDSLAGYFAADYSELSRSAEGAIGYLGSVLRPLLPAGLFVWWINGRTTPRALILFIATLVTMGSFSLNRGYVIVPLVAFGVAYHAKVRRIPAGVVVGGIVALAVAFVAVGSLRTTTLNSQGGKYDVDSPLEVGVATALAHSIQLYGQPPVQTALVVDAGPRRVSTLAALSSALAPLPGAPETLRENTGTRDYNRIIYGKSTPSDQILPSHLEAWWIGGATGLLLWSISVGLTLRWLTRAMLDTSGIASALVLSVASLWTAQAQIVSITVLVQALLYLGPAAFVILALTRRFTIK